MQLGTIPGDPGIYILPTRYWEHTPLHMVESLAICPPPPKHHTHHIPGNKKSHALADKENERAYQRAIAQISLHPTTHLPKDFGTDRHIVLEGQAAHIITVVLYTLSAHESHSDQTTIQAKPPLVPDSDDPVTPTHRPIHRLHSQPHSPPHEGRNHSRP